MPSKYKAKPRDDQGSREGSIASKVNRVMTRKWQTVEQIQERAGISKAAVRRRLYVGAAKGVYEYERVIRFKLK